ncbi:MAG: glycerol kinase GlpK [Chloroflexi bacterium]|nr:glycerol kinase GlpK [Chloroflexota bacterium]
MNAYVLAMDQGTTSSRAIVFDRQGAICGIGQREFRQYFPQPGWVEHEPDEIWSSQLDAAHEALRSAGIGAGDLACIGITNQRETTLLWDRATGRAVHPAIVWQCRRTAPAVEALRARGLEPLIRARTGLVPDAYFSGTKVTWLLDNVSGARQAADRGDLAFGTVDSWLLWKLTGGAVHATDRTNASRTMLFDLDRMLWDRELLEAMRVPSAIMPDVRPSVGHFGTTARDLLGAAVPITGIAGDQQAALFGQACFRPGMAKNTYGTGCFVLLHTGARRVAAGSGLLSTAAASVTAEPAFALEGSIFVAGAAIQWLRDELGIINSAAESEPLARSVPDSGGVTVVPAFAGLGAPDWDMYARGAILGVTRGTTRAHVVRATLESIALQTLDVVRAMETESCQPLTELRVDGGATSNDLLMQIQADVLDRPVVRPRVTETTALGAAYLAGLGAGVWPDTSTLEGQWQEESRFVPAMDASAREALLRRWRRGVERAKGWADE